MTRYLYHNKGIYKSNNKFFFNKIEAILEANHSSTWVEWDYHDSIFKNSLWNVEPPISLEELYKQRALQLREAYDHLVLFFSGGVDSWYILKTFMKNNIKLDEIYMWGSFEAEKKHIKKLGNDRNPGYYTREVEQAIPLVKSITKHQKVKVNVFDITRHLLKESHNRDWFYTAGTRFDPTCMIRGKFHKIFREHNDMLDKGKTVGFVYGIDKPRLIRDDNSIYFSFLDLIMTTGTLPTNDILGETWENDEYFYWTPNMPEIAIKQSHMIVNYLKSINKVHLIKHKDNIASFHDEQYYNEVNRVIYPEWNSNIWQIKKPTGAIYNELTKWFIDSNLEEKFKWESSLQELERMCGKKWFNQNTVKKGLKGHLSPWYKISNYSLNSN